MMRNTETLESVYTFYVTGHVQANNDRTFAGSYTARNADEAIAYFLGHVATAFDVRSDEIVIDAAHVRL